MFGELCSSTAWHCRVVLFVRMSRRKLTRLALCRSRPCAYFPLLALWRGGDDRPGGGSASPPTRPCARGNLVPPFSVPSYREQIGERLVHLPGLIAPAP